VVNETDRNRDNRIDFNEFAPTAMSLLGALRVEENSMLADAEGGEHLRRYLVQSLAQVDRWDGASDGKATPMAIARCVGSSGLRFSDAVTLGVILSFDLDKDGCLSIASFADRLHAKLSLDDHDLLHPSDYTQSQLEAYFEALFQIADENKDGVLSPEEFRALLECNGFGLSSSEVDFLFHEADTNHDGLIEYAGEFVPAMVGILRSRAVKEIETCPEGLEAALLARFRTSDPEGRGELEPLEFLRLLLRSDLPRVHPEAVMRIFMSVETSYGGKIEYEQYIWAMMSAITRGAPLAFA